MHAPLALYFIQGGGVQPEGEWQTYFSENETGFAMRVTVIIPEPATAALLLAASATLLTVRRRTTCYLCQTRLADTLKAATKASTQYYFTSGAR